MNETILPVLWYLVICTAMIFYSILDGFDLGVGMLHLFGKGDKERRVFLNAIGPVWDGNEVWLVIVGGALFAGFPAVYATVFSGFYDLAMILLACLMFRAVAIEFRSKKPMAWWRKTWDVVFFVSSLLIAFSLGTVLANLIEGMPIDTNGDFSSPVTVAFKPYAILVGLFSLTLFLMHGAIYLAMKTEGELHNKMRRYVNNTMILFGIMYVIVTIYTLLYMPHMAKPIMDKPWLFLLPIGAIVAFALVPYAFNKRKDMLAFGSSCLGIALLLSLFGIGCFPTLARSTIDPLNNSLTIYNSAASPLTLKVLLVIVAIGVPLVLAYGTCVYRIFKGKVVINSTSY